MFVTFGFSTISDREKYIYEDAQVRKAKNINAYLVDADDVFVESRTKPICSVPQIGIGNKPIDGGHYLFSEEMVEFIAEEPESKSFFHPWIGGNEFLYGKNGFVYI